jgi:hypothetical protein
MADHDVRMKIVSFGFASKVPVRYLRIKRLTREGEAVGAFSVVAKILSEYRSC